MLTEDFPPYSYYLQGGHKDFMSDFTYSAEELRELAAEALANDDLEGAIALADNANETEAAQQNEQD